MNIQELSLALLRAAKTADAVPVCTVKSPELERFPVDFADEKYRREFFARFRDRLAFVKSRETEKGGMDRLPPEAEAALRKALDEMGYPVQD